MSAPALPLLGARRPAARVLLRVAGVAAVAPALAALHRWHDPGVICPLRRLTGVPCPFCGSTTVLIELGGGHLAAAVSANPVTVLAGLAVLVAPLGPGWWWRSRPARTQNVLIVVAAGISWVWQLHRYGFLPA